MWVGDHNVSFLRTCILQRIFQPLVSSFVVCGHFENVKHRDFGKDFPDVVFEDDFDEGEGGSSACGPSGGTVLFRHGRSFTCLSCMKRSCPCTGCSKSGDERPLDDERVDSAPAHPIYCDADWFVGNAYKVAFDCRHTSSRFPSRW